MACVQPSDVLLVEGQSRFSVAEFAGLHCRVCRPARLKAREIDALACHAMGRLGHQYDLKNVIDLSRDAQGRRSMRPTTPRSLRAMRRHCC